MIYGLERSQVIKLTNKYAISVMTLKDCNTKGNRKKGKTMETLSIAAPKKTRIFPVCLGVSLVYLPVPVRATYCTAGEGLFHLADRFFSF